MSEADHELVCKLQALAQKNKKLVHSSVYNVPSAPEMQVRSWRMNEFKYYDIPSPFPTLARGLFTTWISESGEEGTQSGKYKIVARGYDKFFNIGEVPWTTWNAIERNTAPPYHLTLKSNGCIIFVSAITPTKLLVCSKHSVGPVENAAISHAQMGEKWLYKHLEKAGRASEELAALLWDNNWTVVTELCDDSFEEHVLPYSQEKTGLHLHGINESTGQFKTMPPEFLVKFAKEWGFIPTPYVTLNSVAEVKSYFEEVGRSKKWQGEAIEGFVVRCRISDNVDAKDRAAPPYPPGSSFFFKLKYDEPYMMYRDWREITKTVLSATAKGTPIQDVKIPKSKLRRPESVVYVKWVKEEIAKDRKAFDGYNQGHGIIANRERFLRWLASEKGDLPDGLESLTDKLDGMTITEASKKTFGKTIIMPIAIPGCGKTSVAVALKHLFGFGHVQSDDIHAKKPAPIFIKRVVEELNKHDVVVADKNNHLRQHRSDLREAVLNFSPPVRLLALHWALDKPPAMIHRICADRVLERGENHQTLRADAEAKKHEEVIWMFIEKAEEFDDSEADEVIEMDIEEDLEQSLARAIDGCVRILGVKRPTEEEIGQALAAIRSYKPSTKKEEPKKKAAKPRYYAFLPEIDLEEFIGRILQDDAPEDAKNLWKVLVDGKRVTQIPHITIVHSKSLPKEQALWDRCHELFISQTPPTFTFKLGNVVYDDRIMALTVDEIRVATDPGEDTNVEGKAFVEALGDIKDKLHITVGTRSHDIAAFEARTLVENWRNGKAHAKALPLHDTVLKGRVKGLYS